MNALASHLPRYLERLGIAGLPPATADGLTELVRAQSSAIAFESLDAIAGIPITTAPEAIVEKILVRGRGGYCFELNGLFGLALEAAGFRFAPRLARVLYGRAEPGPKTHVCFKVDLAEGPFLVDVGFGGPGLVGPLPWKTEIEMKLREETYRLTSVEGGDVLLERRIAGVWTGLYVVAAEAVRPIDLEMSNYFVSTWERSPFRSTFFAAFPADPGLLLFRGLELIELTESLVPVRTTPMTSPDELHAVLTERFKVAVPREVVRAAWKRAKN